MQTDIVEQIHRVVQEATQECRQGILTHIVLGIESALALSHAVREELCMGSTESPAPPWSFCGLKIVVLPNVAHLVGAGYEA
jgi:hypothetical protein